MYYIGEKRREEKTMREFDYKRYETHLWDNETLNYLAQIHEHKGKQELFSRQKPVELERLIEIAKVQSVESSNRIEGIITTANRIGKLVRKKTAPRNRNEKEIAGYRDVLNLVHESYDYIPLTTNIILQLHRDLMQYADTGIGGRFKATQNYLQETLPDGTTFIRFTPVAPYETRPCVESICQNYNDAIARNKIDPLLLLPIFIHDFLCIHPFDDGNGRMSRLLTVLLLYKSGFEVGKYISIEKHIEKTKNVYYDALEESSVNWHDGNEDPTPFIKYMLGVILASYREFEERVRIINETTVIQTTKTGKQRSVLIHSSPYDIVKAAVDSVIGQFTKKEIVNICPSISEKSVEKAIHMLSEEGYIIKMGVGRSTFYVRNGG
jgi:Fic family protein